MGNKLAPYIPGYFVGYQDSFSSFDFLTGYSFAKNSAVIYPIDRVFSCDTGGYGGTGSNSYSNLTVSVSY